MRKLILLCFLALAACGSDTQPTEFQKIATAALRCPVEQISWSIDEGPAGGTVDQNGNYVAPGCNPNFVDATYHVRATGCGGTFTIPVSVGDRPVAINMCAVVAPETCCRANPTVAPGATIQFYAGVVYNCAGHIEYAVIPPPFCSP